MRKVMKKSMINREKGIISRTGKGKVGGKKRITEVSPERQGEKSLSFYEK